MKKNNIRRRDKALKEAYENGRILGKMEGMDSFTAAERAVYRSSSLRNVIGTIVLRICKPLFMMDHEEKVQYHNHRDAITFHGAVIGMALSSIAILLCLRKGRK